MSIIDEGIALDSAITLLGNTLAANEGDAAAQAGGFAVALHDALPEEWRTGLTVRVIAPDTPEALPGGDVADAISALYARGLGAIDEGLLLGEGAYERLGSAVLYALNAAVPAAWRTYLEIRAPSTQPNCETEATAIAAFYA